MVDIIISVSYREAMKKIMPLYFVSYGAWNPCMPEKKQKWQIEMDCLLCVSNHIVELIPPWQTFSNGSKLEVLTCRPRSDIFINLQALRMVMLQLKMKLIQTTVPVRMKCMSFYIRFKVLIINISTFVTYKCYPTGECCRARL
ncbi:putative PRONE domain, Rop guanine nucleotide exchange factor [Helianthus annuus]|nr:putative PRONE domain, Rop guanine nucleotide exchange factor [Helianthus annuus]